jgi:hypothetical protein
MRQSCAILAGAAAQPPYLPKPDLVSPEPTGEATNIYTRFLSERRDIGVDMKMLKLR